MHDDPPTGTPRPPARHRFLPGLASTPSGRLLGLTVIVFATIGGLTGLVVGLVTYPPTAPFAVLEAGVPATLLGVVVGTLLVALRWCILTAMRRWSHPH